MKKILLLLVLVCINASCISQSENSKASYLMAYFTQKSERLMYAISEDAKNWTALSSKPLPGWEMQFVRDPYIRKVNGVYHLIHTTSFRGNTLGHWTSKDLINWEGDIIQVMPTLKQRVWAPEFVWNDDEKLFYIHWSSLHPKEPSRMVMHYTTTKDFKNIDPQKSQVYYDHGEHCIDLTIEKVGETYYGFHEVGPWKGKMKGNLMVTSASLNPKIDSFAKDGIGKDIFPNQQHPTEAVAGIKLIDSNKWYFYADPNKHNVLDLQAWETTDFKTFEEIKINVPKGAKHCSFIQITEQELKHLKNILSK